MMTTQNGYPPLDLERLADKLTDFMIGWEAKLKAEIEQKRVDWLRDHPGRNNAYRDVRYDKYTGKLLPRRDTWLKEQLVPNIINPRERILAMGKQQ